MPPDAPTARILDGRLLAETVRIHFAPRLAALDAAGHRPRLVAVSVGFDEASAAYVRGQRRGAEQWGIDFEEVALPASASEGRVLSQIRALNEDPRVTGLLLSMPLPSAMGARTLQHAIAPEKDVEGVHPENLGGCLYGRYGLLPCTALAVMALLESAQRPLAGSNAVVVGHSEIVGKPVALLLLAQDATVTVCHKATDDLARHTRQADVLVVAVGKPGLIQGDMVKPGAVVIDVGINSVAGPTGASNRRIVGDVDLESVSGQASALTPVPGGVGPVTVAMLLRNTVLAGEGMPRLDDPAQIDLFSPPHPA